MYLYLLVLVLCRLSTSFAQKQSSVKLDVNVELRWSYDRNFFTMEMEAPTSGWIGIGFSKTKSMKDSDMIMMGVYDGHNYIIDVYADENGAPLSDQFQDAEVISASDKDSVTKVKFRRMLDTLDEDDFEITSGEYNIIWAYGDKDLTQMPSQSDYHQRNRGSITLNLMNSGGNVDATDDRDNQKLPEDPFKDLYDNDDDDSNRFDDDNDEDEEGDEDFDNKEALDFDNTVFLWWKVDGDSITYKFSAPTRGWIGLGFSERGYSMKDSDILIMGVTNEHPWSLDCNAKKNEAPAMDRSQDIRILSSRENGTHTIVKFTRDKDTNDKEDFKITGGDQYVIWAYGHDDLNDFPASSDYHNRNRGTKKLELTEEVKSRFPFNIDSSKGGNGFDRRPSFFPSVNTKSGTSRSKYPHFEYLDFDEEVLLEWKYDDTSITMKLTAPTLGWIGVGFSDSQSMEGADLLIMGVLNYDGYVLDSYSTSNGPPDMDRSQDARVIESKENGTHTSVTITRSLDTNDENDKMITDERIYILWAYGREDLTNFPANTDYHSRNRGSLYRRLLEPGDWKPPDRKDKPDPNDRTHTVPLNYPETVFLRYEYDEKAITMTLSAPSQGWIAIGFSKTGTMKDSDLIMMGVINSQGYVLDCFGVANQAPDMDGSQDVRVLAALQNDTHTVITVKRDLDTRDDRDNIIEEGKIYVLWAYGRGDLTDFPSSSDYHSRNRGSELLELVHEGNSKPTEDPYDKVPKTPISEMPNSVDFDTQVVFGWKFDDINVYFEFIAPTHGWIGVGITPSGSMVGADLILMGVKDDYPYVVDSFARENGIPEIERSRDVHVVSFEEDDEFTRVTVKRRKNTHDFFDIEIKEGDEVEILWAYNHDDLNGIPTGTDYHGRNKGKENVTLSREPEYDAFGARIHEPNPTPSGPTKKPTPLYFPYQTQLNSERTVHLRWNFENGHIILQLIAPTLGWMGIGFTPTKSMAGSDMIMMGVRQGQAYAVDGFARRNGVPVVDKDQHVEVLAFIEGEKYTSVTVKRKRNTTDHYDMALTTGMINVIWAYGKKDFIGAPYGINYHDKNAGLKEIQLITQEMIKKEEEEAKTTTTAATTTTESTGDGGSSSTTTEKESHIDEMYTTFLDDAKSVQLRWRYDDTRITFELSAPTKGWVGIGFSDQPSMVGADIILMGLETRSETPYTLDSFGITNGPPETDDSQDIDLLSTHENGTHSVITIQRKRDTGDEKDRVVKEGEIFVLWAYGERDLLTFPTSSDSHNNNRGYKLMELIHGLTPLTTSTEPAIVTVAPTTTEATRTTETTTISHAPKSVTLDDAGTVYLEWSYDSKSITMTLTYPTTGWIGIGFSDTGTMEDADIVMMGIADDYGWTLDGFSRENGPPDMDDIQDVEVLSSTENGTHTVMTVTRLLDTESEQDVVIKKGDMNVLWAYGSEDLTDFPSQIYYHGDNRGKKRMSLIPGDEEAEEATKPTLQASTTSQPATTVETTQKTTTQVEESTTSEPDIGLMYSTLLNDDGSVQLEWKYDDKDITMKLTAPTTGWIGIGFSYTGTMEDADLIMLGVFDDLGYSLDCISLKNGAPEPDRMQDIEIISSIENGTHTTMTFSRKLETGDEKDMTISEGRQKIIWAYGKEDLQDFPSTVDYHNQNRGMKIVALIPGLDGPDFFEESTTTSTTTTQTSTTTTTTTEATTTMTTTATTTSTTPEPEIEKFMALNDDGSVFLEWDYDDEIFTFKLTTPTNGWFGLGFTETGTMKGADIIIMGVDNDFSYSLDCHAKENGPPEIDGTQDTTALISTENGTHSSMTVERKRRTGDPDDLVIKKGEIQVIWAYGSKNLDGFPADGDHHGSNRGLKTMTLIPLSDKSDIDETDVEVEDPDLITDELNELDIEDEIENKTFIGDVMMDDESKVHFEWTISEKVITMKLSSPTLGWMGIGFSESGTMVDADIIMMGVNRGYGWSLDLSSSKNGPPTMDNAQDVGVVSSLENGTHTVMSIMRYLNTEDDKDYVIKKGKVTLIWAYGENDPTDLPSSKDYHEGNRGSKVIEFISETLPSPSPKSKHRHEDGLEMSTEALTQLPIVKSSIVIANIEDTTAETTDPPIKVLGGGDGHGNDKHVHQEENLHTNIHESRKITEEKEYIDVADDKDAGMTSSPPSTVQHSENPPTSPTTAYTALSQITGGEIQNIESADKHHHAEPKDESHHGHNHISESATENHSISMPVTATTLSTVRDSEKPSSLPTISASATTVATSTQDKIHIKDPEYEEPSTPSENKISISNNHMPSPTTSSHIVTTRKRTTEHNHDHDHIIEPSMIKSPPVSQRLQYPSSTHSQDTFSTSTEESNIGSKSTSPLELPYAESLTADGLVEMKWDYDNENIIIQMTAPTTGWIGIGFSPTGTMAGADMIMMGVRDGKKYSVDTFADHNGRPDVDGSQDIEILSSEESESKTTVTIKRKLATGDNNDITIREGRRYIIWAYGTHDLKDFPARTDYHLLYRGSKMIDLMPEATGENNENAENQKIKHPPSTTKIPQTSTSEENDVTDSTPSASTTMKTRASLIPELPHSTTLSNDGTVELKWIFNEENIILQMNAPTTGWVGVGFTPSSSMAGADMILMGVYEGEAYALDTNSRSNRSPRMDKKQDLKVLMFKENGTHTSVTVERPRDTRDKKDIKITDDPLNVIWAFGDKDIMKSPRSYHYHKHNRGLKKVDLIMEDPTAGGTLINYKTFVSTIAALALLMVLLAKVKKG